MAGKLNKNHAIAALVLGVIEVVFGLIVTICSFVLASKANMSASLTPYWAGIAFIIPGILGIVSGATKNNCCMIAFMVLNIIAFIVEGIGCILVAIVVAIWASYAAAVGTNCVYAFNVCKCLVDGVYTTISGLDDCGTLDTIVSLMYTIVIFLVLAALVTLASSILGCIAVCCTNKSQPGTIIIQQQQPGMIMQPPPPPPPENNMKY